ncbi:MAG: 50S ribosomal protein L9 [Proteobacteria bacterium]|nr:MAG: 50S ribosomal protein L9 [Pseudomonadota bacterium]
MEVILQQDYPALGYLGDKVKVKNGFARNFLIPRGIAFESGSASARELNHRMSILAARKTKLRDEAQEYAKKLEAISLEFFLRIGEAGKSFGSISVKDIDAALRKENVELDKRQIKLNEPIKKGGEHKVQIKLHSEVFANLNVVVHIEVPKSSKDEGAGERGRGRRGAKGRTQRRGKDAAAAEESPQEQPGQEETPSKQESEGAASEE